jgi:Rrf2 family protein
MKIGKSEYYSLLFIHELKKHKPVSITEIAGLYSIPSDFLYKIAGKLKSAGIIVSREGTNGGYMLASDVDSLSLYDVVHSLKDEGVTICTCSSKEGCSKHEMCKAYASMQRDLDTKLKEIKLL